MSVEIRQPNISADTPDQQLLQMRSYLYQLAQQLNWAFSTLDLQGTGGSPSVVMAAASANAKQAPAETFASIKSLIIKSADIVNAYSQSISKKLEGEFVAQSQFGQYREETSQTITENATRIDRVFEDVQTIAGKQHSTDAYIRSGLLGYNSDDTPIYGLEVGQMNSYEGTEVFNKFARFTADKLSFYDSNGLEIAYISDYRLYITNAVITGSLSIANQFDIQYNPGAAGKPGTVDFRWIGG